MLEPSLAFVLEDDLGVCGYVLGALDTKKFRERFINVWLPSLQKTYPDPIGDETTWTRDEQIYHEIHHPITEIYKALELYSSHLHIDLLPRAQGQGQGKRMMDVLLTALRQHGSSAVHLGMFARNLRALRFYKKLGFHLIESEEFPEEIVYLGKFLA